MGSSRQHHCTQRRRAEPQDAGLVAGCEPLQVSAAETPHGGERLQPGCVHSVRQRDHGRLWAA